MVYEWIVQGSWGYRPGEPPEAGTALWWCARAALKNRGGWDELPLSRDPVGDRQEELPGPHADCRRVDERGLSTGRSRPLVPAAEFLERCAVLLGIPVRRLAVRQRDAETSRLRYLVAGVGIERWRQRPGALASRLGRWPEAVGCWAQRAGQLRLSDGAFRAGYESLDERLAEEPEE